MNTGECDPLPETKQETCKKITKTIHHMSRIIIVVPEGGVMAATIVVTIILIIVGATTTKTTITVSGRSIVWAITT